MSGVKTPRNTGAEEEDHSDGDLSDVETPVEVILKQSSASKVQKASLMNNLFSWNGSEKYAHLKDFRMSADLTAEQQYYYWFKGYINVMEGQTFAGEFLEYGKYQEPMMFVKLNPLDTELPTKRPLAAEFDAAVTGDNGKKTKKSSTESSNDLSKCLVYEGHPIFEYCEIERSVKDMIAANKLYKRVLKYMMDVLKYAVQLNKKALWIYNRSDDKASNFFIVLEELRKEFSIKTNFENTIRINQFGMTKMHTTQCKNMDDFISYLYNEKRWLYDQHNIIKTDQEMIKALQFGLVEFDPEGTRFLLNQTDLNPNITFEEVISRMKESRKEFEFLGLAQTNPNNYGEMVSKSEIHNNNNSKYGYRGRNPNYRNNYRTSGHQVNRGTNWSFKVPENEKATVAYKKCFRCGLVGHESRHHNPEVGYNVGYNYNVGSQPTVGGQQRAGGAYRAGGYLERASASRQSTVGYGGRSQGPTSNVPRGRQGPVGYKGRPFQPGNGNNRGTNNNSANLVVTLSKQIKRLSTALNQKSGLNEGNVAILGKRKSGGGQKASARG
jgi:hypothetical protein